MTYGHVFEFLDCLLTDIPNALLWVSYSKSEKSFPLQTPTVRDNKNLV